MKLHLISAAASGLLWARPGSAFQAAKPFIHRAAVPRTVNISPLMVSTESDVADAIEDDATETSDLTEKQALVVAKMLSNLESIADLSGAETTADVLEVARLFARLVSKDLSRGQSNTELEKEFEKLGKEIFEYGLALYSPAMWASYTSEVGQAIASGAEGSMSLDISHVADLAIDEASTSDESSTSDEGSAGSSSLIKTIQELLPNALERRVNFEYNTYGIHAEYPDVELDGMMKMIDGVPSVEYWFSLKKFVRVFAQVLKVQAGLKLTGLGPDAVSTKENYEKLFQRPGLFYGHYPNPYLPAPQNAIDNWDKDKEFARQFLNGVNPVMIEVVKDSAKLTPEMMKFFGNKEGVDIDALAKDNKLFYVDYVGLADLKKTPHQAYPKAYNNEKTLDPNNPADKKILDKVGKEPRYFKAPMIVFRKTEDLKNIEIMAIQLDREADSKVYTADNSGDMEWQFAKTTVATADSQYHQWLSHLGKTHLTMEPHIVAIHNTLRRHDHKLYPFVRPMCRDTLLLNYAARQTLAKFGPNSFGDYMTSVGTGQFMQLILKYWESYDFFKSSAFDEELKGRGFTDDVDLGNYRYRTDGQKIWDAYGRFATSYVDECYKSDTEVVNDKILQKWAHETSDPGCAAVKKFPGKFESKAQLAKTLQTLFWICSGFHAAVNFPQYDFYTFQANKPLGFRKSFEQWEEAAGSEDWMFEEAMPKMDRAKETISTATVLTLPSEHTILDLDYSFDKIGTDSYKAFKQELKTISSEIDAQNEKGARSGEPKYEYLKPENVPASIDI